MHKLGRREYNRYNRFGGKDSEKKDEIANEIEKFLDNVRKNILEAREDNLDEILSVLKESFSGNIEVVINGEKISKKVEEVIGNIPRRRVMLLLETLRRVTKLAKKEMLRKRTAEQSHKAELVKELLFDAAMVRYMEGKEKGLVRVFVKFYGDMLEELAKRIEKNEEWLYPLVVLTDYFTVRAVGIIVGNRN